MKKLLLVMAVMIFVTGCSTNKKNYTPGTYTGIAEGYLNTVEVAVTVDEYYILSIELIRSDDPEILMNPVMAELPQKVIKNNGTDVEGVSGATYTSKSLLEAIDLALEQAIVKE
ncbi:MAG: FMN-binding protein [Tissierellales bacterium]|nr:FMN-binding protein [Tissierellales bacterium]